MEGLGPQARTDAGIRYNVLAAEDEERGLMGLSDDEVCQSIDTSTLHR